MVALNATAPVFFLIALVIFVVRHALRVLSCVVPVFGKADQIYFLEGEIFGQN